MGNQNCYQEFEEKEKVRLVYVFLHSGWSPVMTFFFPLESEIDASEFQGNSSEAIQLFSLA